MNKYISFIKYETAPYWRSKRKHFSTQIRECRELWKYYHCVPYHYFKHRLYERSASTDIVDYVPPELVNEYQRRANPEHLAWMVHDKFETAKYLRKAGVPCVRTFLKISAQHDFVDQSGCALASPRLALDQLIDAPEDLFIKPVAGGVGEGARLVSKKDIDISFLQSVSDVLIQPRLRNHLALSGIFDKSLNTVRIVTLREGENVTLTAACLKVGQGKAYVDNWAKGSIAIGIDLQTAVLASVGATKAAFGRLLLSVHPDSGVRFEGIRLPFWDEVLDTARRGARALSPHVTLGWDIAITPEGPVVLEANVRADFFLLQEACGPLGKTRLAEVARQLWFESRRFHDERSSARVQ